jgi:hypothetical protein
MFLIGFLSLFLVSNAVVIKSSLESLSPGVFDEVCVPDNEECPSEYSFDCSGMSNCAKSMEACERETQ